MSFLSRYRKKKSVLHCMIPYCLFFIWNCLGDVMVPMLALSAEECGFDPHCVIQKTIKLIFVPSLLSTRQHRENAKTGCHGIEMCQNSVYL